MTSRAEHLAGAKQRALDYVDAGDLAVAVSSLVNDLQKHPWTASAVHDLSRFINSPDTASEGLEIAIKGDADGVRRWIESFE